MFGEGDEAGDFTCLELGEEARIPGPEEADVRDIEEEHSDALEPEAEGPADAVWDASGDEEFLLDDTATEDLKPVALPEYLEFPRWAGEWEVGFDPADFEGFLIRVGGFWSSFTRCGEDFNDKSLQRAFEMGRDRFRLLDTEMFCLQRVSLGVYGWVRIFDFNIVSGDLIGVIHYGICGLRRVFQGVFSRTLP